MKQENQNLPKVLHKESNELSTNYPLRPIDLIKTPQPAYAVLKKLKGNNIVFESITLILEKFCLSLNVSKNMDKDQREDCAELIYQKYWYWSPAHLTMAFNNFKMNKYPEIELYHTIDVTLIFKILDRFEKDMRRAKEIHEQEELQEKYKRWSEEAVPMPENVKSAFTTIIKKVDLNSKENIVTKKEPEEWNMTKQWIEEFNLIHSNQPKSNQPVRTIILNNQVMTINDFLIYKLNNQS